MSLMTETPSVPSLEAIAHHEAGHAVAALILGVAVRWVTIVPSEGYLGKCEVSNLPKGWETAAYASDINGGCQPHRVPHPDGLCRAVGRGDVSGPRPDRCAGQPVTRGDAAKIAAWPQLAGQRINLDDHDRGALLLAESPAAATRTKPRYRVVAALPRRTARQHRSTGTMSPASPRRCSTGSVSVDGSYVRSSATRASPSLRSGPARHQPRRGAGL